MKKITVFLFILFNAGCKTSEGGSGLAGTGSDDWTVVDCRILEVKDTPYLPMVNAFLDNDELKKGDLIKVSLKQVPVKKRVASIGKAIFDTSAGDEIKVAGEIFAEAEIKKTGKKGKFVISKNRENNNGSQALVIGQVYFDAEDGKLGSANRVANLECQPLNSKATF